MYNRKCCVTHMVPIPKRIFNGKRLELGKIKRAPTRHSS